MLRRASLLLVVLVINGCASAHVTAFRDPAYANQSYGRLAIFALGMRLDAMAKVEQDICRKLAPTTCVAGLAILPPTRAYTADELNAILKREGIDGVLLLSLASDQANTAYAGTVTRADVSGSSTTTGTANLYGNFGTWNSSTMASVRGEETSTAVYSHSREATGYLGLFDRASGAAVWRGEIRITGYNAIAVQDNEFIRAATTKVASELRAAGLVR